MGLYNYDLPDVLASKLYKQQLIKLERQAIKVIQDFAKKHITCIALSTGKDSTTVLHLAHKAGVLKDIELILFSGSFVETQDTLNMIKECESKYNISVTQTHPTEQSLLESLALYDDTQKKPNIEFVYNVLERPRWSKMDEYAIDGTILGLRAAESRGRKINYLVRGFSYFNKRERSSICQPIANWSTDLVFAYIAMEGVPLHPIYNKFAKLGAPRNHVRQNSIFDIGETSKRDYVFYKMAYPDEFAQACFYFPSIKNYA